MWNETCLILILIFQDLYPLKLAKIVVKCEIEMRPGPPHLSWILDTDLNSELCWPYIPIAYEDIQDLRLYVNRSKFQYLSLVWLLFLENSSRNLILAWANIVILRADNSSQNQQRQGSRVQTTWDRTDAVVEHKCKILPVGVGFHMWGNKYKSGW